MYSTHSYKMAAVFLILAILLASLVGCSAEKLDQHASLGTEATQDCLIDTTIPPQQNKDLYLTDLVPGGKPEPVEPEAATIDENTQLTCYMTISCSTILDNMNDLEDGKDILVPQDGLLFPRTEITFSKGESAFDVLQRITRENKIHLSSQFTPMYNTAYIEGIGNLYEFDCGSGSGWMYCVNNWYPNYGVSRYCLQQGDELEFNFTCDLGRDLGADWMG